MMHLKKESSPSKTCFPPFGDWSDYRPRGIKQVGWGKSSIKLALGHIEKKERFV
jgi:hypothetical protein